MEADVDYFIEKLDSAHQLRKFSLGKDPDLRALKIFLQQEALNYQAANVAVTYVAALPVTATAPRPQVIGFITLTCSEVDLGGCYRLDDCEHANRYSNMPAMKVARLARHAKYRDFRIGEALMNFAIALAADYVGQSVGCRFLVTDAKRRSIGFYEGQGFRLLDTAENRERDAPVMFLDLNKDLNKAGAEDAVQALDAAFDSVAQASEPEQRAVS